MKIGNLLNTLRGTYPTRENRNNNPKQTTNMKNHYAFYFDNDMSYYHFSFPENHSYRLSRIILNHILQNPYEFYLKIDKKLVEDFNMNAANRALPIYLPAQWELRKFAKAIQDQLESIHHVSEHDTTVFVEWDDDVKDSIKVSFKQEPVEEMVRVG